MVSFPVAELVFQCNLSVCRTFLLLLILGAAAEPTMGIMRLDLMQSLMLIPIKCWLSGYSPLLTSI